MIVFSILNAKYTAHPFRATCRHGYVAEGFLIAIKSDLFNPNQLFIILPQNPMIFIRLINLTYLSLFILQYQ